MVRGTDDDVLHANEHCRMGGTFGHLNIFGQFDNPYRNESTKANRMNV